VEKKSYARFTVLRLTLGRKLRPQVFAGGISRAGGSFLSRKDGQCTVEILCAGSARQLRLNHVGEALKPLGCRTPTAAGPTMRKIASRRGRVARVIVSGLAGLPWPTYLSSCAIGVEPARERERERESRPVSYRPTRKVAAANKGFRDSELDSRRIPRSSHRAGT